MAITQFIDPYAYQRGQQMIEAANLTRAQAAEVAANAESKRFDTVAKTDAYQRSRAFMADVANAEAQKAPALVPGIDFPDSSAEVGGDMVRSANPDVSSLKKKPEWQKQLDEADKQDSLAAMARKRGLPDDKYSDNARQLRDSGMKAKREAEQDQIKHFEQGLTALDTIEGPDSAQRVLTQIDRQRPGTPEGFGFSRDMAGRWTWDDNAVKTLATLKGFLRNQLDERKYQQENERIDIAASEVERKRERDEQMAQLWDQLAAARQTKNESDAKLVEAKIAALATQEARADAKILADRTKAVQTRLDRNDAVKTFPKYEQAYQQAEAVRDAIADDKTYKNINALQIDTLTNAYTAMRGMFRQQRSGTKWEAQSINQFNGLLQKTEKWISTLGQGTPAVNRSTALNIVNAMQEMYAIAGANTLRAELEAQNARGVDPKALILHATHDDALLNLLQKRGFLKVLETDKATKLPLKVQIFGTTYNAPKQTED